MLLYVQEVVTNFMVSDYINWVTTSWTHSIRPRSLYPFCIVINYINRVKTSWTCGTKLSLNDEGKRKQKSQTLETPHHSSHTDTIDRVLI